MSNSYFQFKQFIVNQEHCAMKVSTEACILGAWTSYLNPKNILDIGAGTGLLSLMMAQKYDCQIDAIEIEHKAANQAKDNFGESIWRQRLKLIHSDIKYFADENEKHYDLIISNPPFFSNSLKSRVASSNLAKHDDGLSKEVLVDSISKLMSKHGTAYILFPEREADELRQVAFDIGLEAKDSLIVKNRAGNKVFRKIVALGNISGLEPSELVIREIDGDYSELFKELLEPYYLKL